MPVLMQQGHCSMNYRSTMKRALTVVAAIAVSSCFSAVMAAPEKSAPTAADAGAQFNAARSAYARKDVAALTAMANQGNAYAQSNLGLMYAKGEGVVQDYAAAVPWYRKAADQGHAMARSNLGVMYANGTGVAQDYAAALSWCRKAADQGLANAQNNLGLMYANGTGVAQDYAASVSWYHKAADQGYAKAQYNLGVMYAKGTGVPTDYVKAYMWLNLAAAQGHADAQTNKSTVSERMTPADLSRAQRLSSECVARHYKGC
jgi:TPR repeat protein